MKKLRHLMQTASLILFATPVFLCSANAQSSATAAPVYKITREVSTISFDVKASISGGPSPWVADAFN